MRLQNIVMARRVARMAVEGLTNGEIALKTGMSMRWVAYVLKDKRVTEEVDRLVRATDATVIELLEEGERKAAATLGEALDATAPDGSPLWDIRIKAAVRFLDAAGRRGKPADKIETQMLSLTGDAAKAALVNALRDPGVRAFLAAQPELRAQLLPEPDDVPVLDSLPTPGA